MGNRHAAAPYRANVGTDVARPTAGRKRAAEDDEGGQAKRQRVAMITTGGKSPRRQAVTAAVFMAGRGDVADGDTTEACSVTPTTTGAPQTPAAGFDAHAMPPHFDAAETLETTSFATPLNFDAAATPTTARFAMPHNFAAVATPGGTSSAVPLNFATPASSSPTLKGASFATPLNVNFPTSGTTTTLDRSPRINKLQEQGDRVDPLLAPVDPQAAAKRPYVPPRFMAPVTRTVEFEIKLEDGQDEPLIDHGTSVPAPQVSYAEDLHAEDWVFQKPTVLDEGLATRAAEVGIKVEEDGASLSAPLVLHVDDLDAEDWVFQRQPIPAMSPEAQDRSAASPGAESPLAPNWLVLDGEDRVKAEEQDVGIPGSPAAFPSARVDMGLLTPEAEFEGGDWDDVTDPMEHYALQAQSKY
ncbi:hypothetical protein AURDEDRAFT_168382 [Auricularia subglabra TFB-10046 SS5]|nr:hypothetical protein AURDEDRAFT_168382 [Auricularia subglabra TFB-10046 SS5]